MNSSLLLFVATVGILITESHIARRFRRFDPSLPHSRAFFDCYYFWLLGLIIFFLSVRCRPKERRNAGAAR